MVIIYLNMAERKRTNAEIDVLNQFLKEGEAPLPYEIQDSNTPTLTDEEKAAAEEKLAAEQKIKDDEAAAAQKIIDDAAEVEKKRIIAQQEEKTKTTSTANTPLPEESELDDEKVLAYFKNKKGKELSSLDELLNPRKELTEEEKKQLAEQRDANKIAYGLSKGIFSKKQLEEFINDTKNPKDLVLAAYMADQKQIDDTLTDTEIEEEFAEKFGLNEKEDSRGYKAGQTLINNIADRLISKKHSKILNLENDFSSYESTQSEQKSNEEKILQNAPIYKKDIEVVRSEIKKVSIPISKDENFEYDLPQEAVDNVISKMLSNDYSAHQISTGWNKETLKQVAQTSAIIENLPNIMKQYADAQILKQQKGVRGILPQHERGARQQEGELTERQKQALDFAFPQPTQAPVAN